MRLHGYPRDTDSCIKKWNRRKRREERKREKELALSDLTFYDRLMWDRAAIKYGEEVTALFITRVMDH